ncbi:unnamed protein product [Phytophthora lilii]|uniref:Unnamed protein product n=1 Tax=Phytophthora lilii TaxID=2077276 RepID=A0A9W6WYQ6_9STRA|nr:unnamed protein product [Phytophthora lilii]
MVQLKAHMIELQQRAIAPREEREDKQLYTTVLRNVVKKQQLAFVDIQAAMTGYATSLQDARAFLSRRLSHLNPLNAMSEEHRFENDDGDYWAVRFVVSQFESAHSAKQVYDLVVYYLSNSEISISEKVGHLTVREDDDSCEPGIMQHYLSSVTGKGLRMESNTVIFYEYREADRPGNHDAYGLLVSDFVDEDEGHPYRSNERIRKDVNAVMEVRAYPRHPCRVEAPLTSKTFKETK